MECSLSLLRISLLEAPPAPTRQLFRHIFDEPIHIHHAFLHPYAPCRRRFQSLRLSLLWNDCWMLFVVRAHEEVVHGYSRCFLVCDLVVLLLEARRFSASPSHAVSTPAAIRAACRFMLFSLLLRQTFSCSFHYRCPAFFHYFLFTRAASRTGVLLRLFHLSTVFASTLAQAPISFQFGLQTYRHRLTNG